MSDDSLRDIIAQIIYGDGNDVSWARAVELSDLIIWGTGLRQLTHTTTEQTTYCQRCGIPHTDNCKRGTR